jgi:hypothetical protein
MVNSGIKLMVSFPSIFFDGQFTIKSLKVTSRTSPKELLRKIQTQGTKTIEKRWKFSPTFFISDNKRCAVVTLNASGTLAARFFISERGVLLG